MIKNFFVTVEKNLPGVNKQLVHKIVNILMEELNFTIQSMELNLISTQTIQVINKKYLKHNYPTDILTFNYSGSENNLEGEIFISVEEAKRNAKKFKCSFEQEIVRLIVHGFLHLIGYNDDKPSRRKKMEIIEDHFVAFFHLLINGKELIYDSRIC
ncbi:MAG: rRNA maturation RNase YbeY [Ignavibacteriales bacterium]|nr:rRNA maturation RNase YbeY [Ignavibacteriales bacterium]